MAAEISREDQAALDLHRIMLEAMRSRESEILRFLGFLLPAIAGLFAIGWLRSDTALVPIRILLPSISLLSIIILFFGAWYALALSYNYRYIHIVVYHLQEHLGLRRFQPQWEPVRFERPSRNPRYKSCDCLHRCYKWFDYLLFGFAPEIIRTQLSLFVVLIPGVALASTLASINACPPLDIATCWLVWGATFVALGLLVGLGFFFYPSKYNERLEQASGGSEKTEA